jgi:hypothetical protein
LLFWLPASGFWLPKGAIEIMFITKKHIPRRTFLKGAGVTIALPLLEAMLPAQTPSRQTAANAKSRFTAIFFPHGMAPGYWIPKTDGTNFDFPFIMEPLAPYRDRVVILSGLWAKSAEPPPGVTGADHWVASAFLCANKPKKTTGADIYNGMTIDQVIARKIGQDTLLPSLQMAIEDPSGSSSTCGEGYSCAYTNSISWSAPDRPLPMEINPQVVFERLFGDGSTPQERNTRREQDRSILDSVTRSLASLRKEIGPGDRVRLDQYLEDVREIERRLDIAAKASAEAPTSDVPFGVPESFDEHIKLQFDLNALAFQGDITRVSTLLGARDLTGKNYPDSGTNTSFHGGSHHAENPQRIADYAKINRYHVACLAYFLNKLKSTPDGDGTLLDHSLVFYGTNMGNSNQHLHYDVPHILAGAASGKLKGGRHIAHPSKTITTGNLLLSLMDMYDIHQDSIGDSTGRLQL